MSICMHKAWATQEEEVKEAIPSISDEDFSRFDSICAALDCDLSKGDDDTCGYGCPEGSRCFQLSRRRTGNYAAGVPGSPHSWSGRPLTETGAGRGERDYYLGTRIPPGERAIMETPAFSLLDEALVEFDFFEVPAFHARAKWGAISLIPGSA